MALSHFTRFRLDPFGSRFGFDPLTEMRRMQDEMNRLFAGVSTPVAREFPPVNLWIGENSVAVTAELPGVGSDDIDVTVRDDTLTLQGKVEPKVDEEKVSWQRRERTYGTFSRTVQLPFRVDPDRVQARFNNGVLEIELQRPEADRPKKIQIRAA